MIRAQFCAGNGRIRSVVVSGHSGYAEAGADIICAAVSSAVSLAACILAEFGLTAIAVSEREEPPEIRIALPERLPEAAERAAQNVLAGLLAHLSSVAEEYPAHIEVMEG